MHSNGFLPPPLFSSSPWLISLSLPFPFLVWPLNYVYSQWLGLLTLHLALNPIIRLWLRAIQNPFLFSSSDHGRHFFCSNPTLKMHDLKKVEEVGYIFSLQKELFEVLKMRGFQTCGNAITTWATLPIGRLTTAWENCKFGSPWLTRMCAWRSYLEPWTTFLEFSNGWWYADLLSQILSWTGNENQKL